MVVYWWSGGATVCGSGDGWDRTNHSHVMVVGCDTEHSDGSGKMMIMVVWTGQKCVVFFGRWKYSNRCQY